MCVGVCVPLRSILCKISLAQKKKEDASYLYTFAALPERVWRTGDHFHERFVPPTM